MFELFELVTKQFLIMSVLLSSGCIKKSDGHVRLLSTGHDFKDFTIICFAGCWKFPVKRRAVSNVELIGCKRKMIFAHVATNVHSTAKLPHYLCSLVS